MAPAKKYQIKAPDINDDSFDIPASTGLEKQWESWKGQVNYQFKDEQFEKLQMELGYGDFFMDDEMDSEERKNAK